MVKREERIKGGERTEERGGIRMEAVIGDSQQEGCLLSLKEDRRETEEREERGRRKIRGG